MQLTKSHQDCTSVLSKINTAFGASGRLLFHFLWGYTYTDANRQRIFLCRQAASWLRVTSKDLIREYISPSRTSQCRRILEKIPESMRENPASAQSCKYQFVLQHLDLSVCKVPSLLLGLFAFWVLSLTGEKKKIKETNC